MVEVLLHGAYGVVGGRGLRELRLSFIKSIVTKKKVVQLPKPHSTKDSINCLAKGLGSRRLGIAGFQAVLEGWIFMQGFQEL